MGQHKHNPKAILAKEGMITPKKRKKKLGRRALELLAYQYFAGRTGVLK